MLKLSDIICANEQHVAAKVMDGEAILINLGTGAYYSIGSTGGFIWSLIEKRLSIDAIVRCVTEHYVVTRGQAETEVLRLVEELRVEELVAVSADGAASGAAPPAAATRFAYEFPVIEKFTDMAEMFALDPPLPGLAKRPAGKPGAKG